jgi:hypothetical protein
MNTSDWKADAAAPAMAIQNDPTLVPAFSLQNRLRRVAWNLCYAILYRISPRPLHGWRSLLLRAFGAKLGAACHFYPKGKIWAPWNLVCEDRVTLADDAELYNPLSRIARHRLPGSLHLRRHPPL